MHTRYTSVAGAVDRAVREFPDHDALETADRTFSYREFGALTDDLARRLAEHTAPGEFVGIESRRDAGAVVAVVGALKARRPFVIIDGRDSESSNADKVRLLGLRTLAATSSPDGHVDLTEVPRRWLPDGRAPGIPWQPPRALPSDGGEVGYAISTSGSTGKPKCVLVRAAPLAPVIRDHVERLEVGPGSRTLQFARLTFDGCLTEILWTLTAGACLVVLDESRLAPGAILAETLERSRISHLKTTPFALTVTAPTPAMRLEHVVNGGGPCRLSVLRKWSAATRFHNAYGLTETTVCNLLTDPLDPDECRESVPLGTVVGDCAYHLRETEPELETEAEGARPRRGELVITGESVALGYLTEHGLRPFREDGTEAYGAEPYGAEQDGAGAVYRTGDIVEERDGSLHFVERADRQVKVRGYRLDPGEIENAVCRLETVADAVVVAEAHDSADADDLDVLVCYYQGGTDARTVRRHLERVLDSYKIPSVLDRVESFPYTPNGKVDREALRAGRRRVSAQREPHSAGGPDQRVLHLVRTLTGVEDVQLDDNFFDVGGDSASAVVLVTKMKELGWRDVGIRDVLRAENLRGLTEQLPERSV
ncbi:non-ribosomal peptide synthetase [Streptomyces sp. ODS28]|uniref:non-ribosomal peptide synthetase n=1 Tax=Streptomyces sp. ODS28 TaxID=3136688 RepID=UPI0031E6B108